MFTLYSKYYYLTDKITSDVREVFALLAMGHYQLEPLN